MKILHCMLSCFYIDNYNYQENVLPKIHKKMGNDVKIIASTETFDSNGKVCYIKSTNYINEYGIPVVRIPYNKMIPAKLNHKLRVYSKLYSEIELFKPDVILYHGLGGYAIKTVVNYKKNNPSVIIYADGHEDYNNSARNFLSKYLLHKFINKSILKSSVGYIEKFLGVSVERCQFINEMYDIDKEKIELYPLGGEIVDEKQKTINRKEVIEELNLKKNSIIFVHSGKMDYLKRTYELLLEFEKISNENFVLLIIGNITEDVKEKIMPIIRCDVRIKYLGWKKSEELIKYISAAHLYLQPGGHSVSMENSLCAGTPVLAKNFKCINLYGQEAFFIMKDYCQISKIFENISKNTSILDEKSKKAYIIARDKLDYEKLAKRILY